VEYLAYAEASTRPEPISQTDRGYAIGEEQDTVSDSKRHPSKRRAGGLTGSKARAKSLGPNERHEIAKLAARARWKKKD
jgi:hypothetical protein